MDGRPLRVTAYIDGGARGNPGPAGAGVVIVDRADGAALYEGGLYLGRATNNVAEYRGLLAALAAAAVLRAEEVEVVSDSQLLVRQMTGEYRVKNAGLQPLHRRAQELAKGFARCGFRHVRREDNVRADELVNMAIDQRRNVESAAT
jgi:ribonuclease HI